MAVRWIFKEVVSGVTYTLPMNPNQGGTPTRQRQIYLGTTSGPGGKTIVQSGRLQPSQMTFSGLTLTQEHYEKLDEWASKNTLIEIEDDLARKFRGIFITFNPERVRNATRPWRHRFQATFIVTQEL